MIEDIGADEYKIEENEKEFFLRIGSTNNKINLNISTRDNKQFKNYSGQFTLDDLKNINRVFLLTRTIYEAKEEFKKAIERKKIAISERDDYIHTVFYLMIGTDTSTLSIALPRDETPRIIRLEHNLNILKLGKDNLSDRLAVFEQEAEEIKRDLEKIKIGNATLEQISDTIGQGIPDVSEILREYKANRKNPNYTSYNQKINNDNYNNQEANVPYSSVNAKEAEKDLPYSSYNQKNDDKPYTSYNERNLDQPYTSHEMNKDQPYTSTNIQQTNFEPIKESLNEQNRESSIPNENNEQDNYNLDMKNLELNQSLNSNQNQEDDEQEEKFPNGILKNIIKEEDEIENVLNKISEKCPGCRYKLLYKGSRDGDTANDFHSRCDDAEKTLVIVEDNYGNRFGGFTTQDWGGQYLQKKDDDAFIFSVDKNKIYEVIPDQNAIGCYPNFGPVFFGCQIRIYDNFLTKGGTTYKKGLNYRTTEDFELTNGNQNFGVRDIEVYEIESQ